MISYSFKIVIFFLPWPSAEWSIFTTHNPSLWTTIHRWQSAFYEKVEINIYKTKTNNFASQCLLPAFLAADKVSRFFVSGISLVSINDDVDEIVGVVAVEVAMGDLVVVGFEVVVVVVIIGFVGLKVD